MVRSAGMRKFGINEKNRKGHAPGLLWSNIRLEADGSAFEITFDKRKNAQFRQ